MIPFIITIDTEGDNLWSKPHKITTNNSKYLPRFQQLCEKYGFKPVYLTNWEMANCQFFQEFGKDVITRKAGEIGMHLHAWNSPPIEPLTANDYHYQPFLIEYSTDAMRAKIELMTKTLEENFQVKIISHRAGRWAINNNYLKLLKEFGYKIDCSITPHVNWSVHDAQYNKNNINYENLSTRSYFVDTDIFKESTSDFLEVPVTILKDYKYKNLRKIASINKLTRKTLNYLKPELLWMRPNGYNLKSLIKISNTVIKDRKEYAEFILHSSELMPGGSPTFKDAKSIETLFSHLNELFERMKEQYVGLTLAEFRAHRLKHKMKQVQ